MEDLHEQIKKFIIDNFMFGGGNGLKNDTSLLSEGIIDSTGILELVTFLEETFAVTFDDDELIPENLDSVNNIASCLHRKGIQ